MKKQVNAHRSEVTFQVGDFVYLKLQLYRRKTLASCINEKLSPRFYGPYKIIDRVGLVAYCLQLPDSSRIHPMFHVFQLRKAIGHTPALPTISSQLVDDLELIAEPEAVLGIRLGSIIGHQGFEVLIKWKGLPDFEASWVTIQQQLPFFHLEDKVTLRAKGIDRTPIRFTYSRRKHRGHVAVEMTR